MLPHFKSILKKLIFRFPPATHLYLKTRVYRRELDEKTLRSKIQQVGHRIDLHITKKMKVPKDAMKEFEFAIKQIKSRQLAVDESICWALERFAIGKYRLEGTYVGSSEEPDSLRNEDAVVNALMGRRSVRKWSSEPIDMTEIEKVIEAARWAPSSCNRQLWQALLINNKKDKEFLRDYFSNEFWFSAPLLIMILMDTAGYGKFDRHYAYLDGGAFIQNMLLALYSRGYGACWIGFTCWDTLNNIHVDHDRYDRFYAHFKVEKHIVPISMVALGKPDIIPKRPSRQSADNILIKDRLK